MKANLKIDLKTEFNLMCIASRRKPQPTATCVLTISIMILPKRSGIIYEFLPNMYRSAKVNKNSWEVVLDPEEKHYIYEEKLPTLSEGRKEIAFYKY